MGGHYKSKEQNKYNYWYIAEPCCLIVEGTVPITSNSKVFMLHVLISEPCSK